MRRLLGSTLCAQLLLASLTGARAVPSLETGPASTTAGAQVEVLAEGYTGGEDVVVFLGDVRVGDVVADADGRIEAQVRVPEGTPPGTQWVSCVGTVSHRLVQTRVRVSDPVNTDVALLRRADGSGWTANGEWLSPSTVPDLRRAWATPLDHTEPGATYPPSEWGGATYGEEVTVWALLGGVVFATWESTYVRADGIDHDRTVLMALDATTGEVRWERTFDDGAFARGFEVIAAGGASLVLSLDEDDVVAGVDPETGETRWTRNGYAALVSIGDEIIVPLTGADPPAGVWAIDAVTGAPRRRIAVERVDHVGEAAVADEELLSVEWMVRPGRWTAMAFEAPTGTLRWGYTRPTDASYDLILRPDVVVTGFGSIVGDGEVRALNRSDGETLWAWVFPREDATEWVWAEPCAATDDTLFVRAVRCFSLEACNGDERLVALDAASGHVRWDRAVGEAGDGPSRGPIAVAGDVIAADGGRYLLDATTGEVLRTFDLSYQQQPFPVWPGAPILADGRMFTASMDSVVVFQVLVRGERPSVESLLAEVTPPSSSPPAETPAPARPEGGGGTWTLLAGGIVAVGLLVLAAAVLWRRTRVRRGAEDDHVSAS
jgi:outer membrane protein assembly factor BamB